MNRSGSVTDPQLIPRVKQYLEENVHQTYVDVGVMAKALQDRYREYQRRKTVPFRFAVEQAYKTVLHSYGLDSNPGSDLEEEGSDLEVMDESQNANHLTDAFTAMYKKKSTQPVVPTNDGELIDISSDDESENGGELPKKTGEALVGDQQSVTITKINPSSGTLNGNNKLPTDPELPKQLTTTIPINKKRRIDNEDNLMTSGPQQQQQQQAFQIQPHQQQSLPPPQHHQMQPSKPKKFKKEVYAKKSNYTFADVGGMDKTLKELCELILHVKHPEIYRHIGLPAPRGFLLHGPPGSGKNLLAHAIAGQLDVSLIEIPATELVAGVSGESEERIREIFEQSAALAPCVLFIDEIDAISSNRMNAQKDMERRIVAQLLTSLDNLSKLNFGDQVLVIGATNRPDSLDPALRRVGRFDHEICLGIPDREARSEILQVIAKNLKLEIPFDFDELAALTPGYVGADLLALATKAASNAIKRVLSKKENEELIASLNVGRCSSKPEAEMSIVNLDEYSILMEVDDAMEGIKEATENKVEETAEPKEQEKTDNGELPKEETAGAEEKEKPTEETKAEEVKETAEPITEEPEKQEAVKEPEAMEQEEPTVEPPAAEKVNEEVTENKMEQEVVQEKPAEETTVQLEEPPKEEKVEEEETLVEVVMRQPGVKLQLSLDNMIKWLRHDAIPLSIDEMKNIAIMRQDFLDALKFVQPSAKREGFITVPDVTWEDVGSLQNIREELKLAILAPVKFPERLKILGLQSPSGVLLCGPPGCGKTLLAKAIANEAGINFISVKGPELLNMYVGESERAVRQVFQRARNSAPCVIFFDEFDSLCPKRSDNGEGSGSSMRVVNQLLTEMDGMEERKGVFLMAATNRPDIVDPAVLRPGRLDKILYVGLPEEKDRSEILMALTKNRTKPPLAADVDLQGLAKITDGFTGADLAGLVRQASLQTLKDSILTNDSVQEADANELIVNYKHFLSALKKMKPSVTPEDIQHYEKLKQKYGQENQME